MSKTIFIVDDDADVQMMYLDKLKSPSVSIIAAFTLKEAEEKFSSTEHIDLIIMDGNIDHEYDIDSTPLIRKIRLTYKGPMIAASRSEFYRRDMMNAGCDHESEKSKAHGLAKEILRRL